MPARDGNYTLAAVAAWVERAPCIHGGGARPANEGTQAATARWGYGMWAFAHLVGQGVHIHLDVAVVDKVRSLLPAMRRLQRAAAQAQGQRQQQTGGPHVR